MGNNNTDATKNKHQKKKIIICAVIALILIVCGVVCLLVFMPSQADRAFSNFRDTVKSVIDPSANTNIKHKNIVAEISFLTKDSSRASSANPSMTIQGNNEKAYIKIYNSDKVSNESGVEATATRNGELYVKISGIGNAIENDSELSTLKQFEEIPALKSIFKDLDNKWLYFSAPEVEETISAYGDNIVTCLAREYKNRAIIKKAEEIYNADKFLSYEEYEGSDIEPTKSGKIYEVKINSNKLSSFAKSLSETASNNIKNCVGVSSEEDNQNIFEELEPSIKEEVIPKMYVEIVDTDIVNARIISAEGDEVNIVFSYPESIDFPAVEKEKSIIELITKIMSDVGA